ncbi:MAG: hypothetical protein PVSMB8_17030 [Vulcanimicrobiaceae bacterium]
MTILATHFAIVLGAWRLRIRIDVDEPCEADLRAEDVPEAARRAAQPTADGVSPRSVPWGRG